VDEAVDHTGGDGATGVAQRGEPVARDRALEEMVEPGQHPASDIGAAGFRCPAQQFRILGRDLCVALSRMMSG